eukprot:CAMPEP_0113458024 /NCGR_PEP_ID=MMETSP0014_2-20120614/9707_1 /TAXON_ID=2857 /ORGANISM="Nitzschia sp." /LENGTH=519 /DNA_ID=CAMNT_0000349531 /DNA_START=310 /DNA_END=1869 /DNA_ORIENTATION=- /assembly_acc=CAM_ASM_000159
MSSGANDGGGDDDKNCRGKKKQKNQDSVPPLIDILKDDTFQTGILTFPKNYTFASAPGFCRSADGKQVVFVKDRDEEEAQVQAFGSLCGQVFSDAFGRQPIVARNEWISRPKLDDLHAESPWHCLWKEKEDTWRICEEHSNAQKHAAATNSEKMSKEQTSFKGEEKKSEGQVNTEVLNAEAESGYESESSSSSSSYSSSSSSDSSERKPAPSEYECWQIEEAVQYYDKNSDSDGGVNTIDASVRRKLRAAADRSKTGCLDLITVMFINSITQYDLEFDESWKKYKEYALLDNPDDALTRAEMYWLLWEKMSGVEYQAAVIYAAAHGLPDASDSNAVLQEVDNGGGSWTVRAVHIDAGLLPASAGTTLESLPLHPNFTSEWNWCGGPKVAGYYMPRLLLFPGADMPLLPKTIEGLHMVEANRFVELAEKHLDPKKWKGVLVSDLYKVGEIMKQRVVTMQKYAAENPQCTVRELVYQAIPAWKRDYQKFLNKSDDAEWYEEVKGWALKGKNKALAEASSVR